MADSASPTHSSTTSTPSGKVHTGRQRTIASCLTCRRRKVRCDHGHPICGACQRGNHICTYATEQAALHHQSSTGVGKVSKLSPPASSKLARNSDVQARLDRLEALLEKAVTGSQNGQKVPCRSDPESPHDRHPDRDPHPGLTPSSNSGSIHGAGISSDGHDGTLLLEDGQSQFVSSLHWALLADEIQDIKALLGDGSEQETANKHRRPTQTSLGTLFALGSGTHGIDLTNFLPDSQEHCESLLDTFFTNVDPMTRVIHKPTLLRQFNHHVRDATPLAFAIFFSATNSMNSAAVKEKYGVKRDLLMERFEQGLEVSLARDNFLTSASLEVLQGFVLWLTCITKEDDMSKAWTLLGLAIRIGLNQGLHRDPSLFPAGSMDTVTIEVRRRLWHQICHLEFRAAECKGQEPTVSDDDFTTMMPRNVNDEDLEEGSSPGTAPYDRSAFTDMAFQLVRFTGMRCMRRIIQSTYRLERRILWSGLRGHSAPDPVLELQILYKEIKTLVDEMIEENRTKYLQYCDINVPMQRLCLGLASLIEWRPWVLFWLRIPRAYRDSVFSIEIRRTIFFKSVNLIETINGATADADAERFHWHIGGHASFQAIMHVLSELRNPEFETPDRLRALRALQITRTLKEGLTSKPWLVVKSMIDKVISDHLATQLNRPQTTPTSSTPYSTSEPMDLSKQLAEVNMGTGPPFYVDENPSYTLPEPTRAPGLSGQVDFPQMNLNNMVGMDLQDVSMDFDWGFWGDPVDLATVDYTS
ncbi:hypothetical protein BU16DRAFT_153767 [Lophium mytilinum]|uniref:Zn(2)-C6 fungal-type domain-containing protein n=1 Tax=Lophium mytilinum TaxID=390894 RepID=A0A6A6QEM2_9PEZI|nr:hypothetical protein BU16DRAFT_153767 [Lophium mytilinum]